MFRAWTQGCQKSADWFTVVVTRGDWFILRNPQHSGDRVITTDDNRAFKLGQSEDSTQHMFPGPAPAARDRGWVLGRNHVPVSVLDLHVLMKII
jgi:hypothetical protein